MRYFSYIVLSFVLNLVYGQKTNQYYTVNPACFNSEEDEYSPRIIQNKIWLLSNSKDENGKIMKDQVSKKSFTDVFEIDHCMKRDAVLEDNLTRQKIIISSLFFDGPVTEVNGGSYVIFNNNSSENLDGRMGLFVLKRNDDSSYVYYDHFSSNSSRYNIVHPFYDEASKLVYFASDMDSTSDPNYDIYQVRFEDGFIGEPKKCAGINTPYNELFPTCFDGVLYFASNRNGGFGNLDIYTYKNNKVVRLPEPVNSKYDDFDFYFLNKDLAFLSSNRNTNGGMDDVFLSLFSSEHLEDSENNAFQKNTEASANLLAQLAQTDNLDDEKLAYMKSIKLEKEKANLADLRRKDSLQQLSWAKEVNDIKLKVFSNKMKDSVVDYLKLAEEQNYFQDLLTRYQTASPEERKRLNAEIRRFLDEANLSIDDVLKFENQMEANRKQTEDRNQQLKKIDQDLAKIESQNWDDALLADIMSQMNEEERLAYESKKSGNAVYFGFDAYQLKNTDELYQLVALLKSNTSSVIKLEGHTDNIGLAAYNKRLSKRRVNAVQDYLVDQGIDQARIQCEYFGAKNPTFDNSTKEGRAKNRRVDIKVLPH